jgi:CDP-diacylglycerol---glycerol-3-phosphate 3-phosphatidyltransferase
VFPVNAPNVLTVIRILLVPVLVVALLDKTPNGDVVAAIVFAVASGTDFVDGWLARSRGDITNFGKLMDPLADKLLVIAALVSLVSLNRLAAWVAMVIIARELFVTMLRAHAKERGVVVAAGQFGKLKTVIQIAAIMALILSDGGVGVDALVYLMVAVTVASGVDYGFGIRRRIEEAERARSAEARI